MVHPELAALAEKLMDTMPGAVVPVTDVEMSLLQTGSAFVVLSAGEHGVSAKLVDPYV